MSAFNPDPFTVCSLRILKAHGYFPEVIEVSSSVTAGWALYSAPVVNNNRPSRYAVNFTENFYAKSQRGVGRGRGNDNDEGRVATIQWLWPFWGYLWRNETAASLSLRLFHRLFTLLHRGVSLLSLLAFCAEKIKITFLEILSASSCIITLYVYSSNSFLWALKFYCATLPLLCFLSLSLLPVRLHS